MYLSIIPGAPAQVKPTYFVKYYVLPTFAWDACGTMNGEFYSLTLIMFVSTESKIQSQKLFNISVIRTLRVRYKSFVYKTQTVS